jgi:hypothetical protein
MGTAGSSSPPLAATICGCRSASGSHSVAGSSSSSSLSQTTKISHNYGVDIDRNQFSLITREEQQILMCLGKSYVQNDFQNTERHKWENFNLTMSTLVRY